MGIYSCNNARTHSDAYMHFTTDMHTCAHHQPSAEAPLAQLAFMSMVRTAVYKQGVAVAEGNAAHATSCPAHQGLHSAGCCHWLPMTVTQFACSSVTKGQHVTGTQQRCRCELAGGQRGDRRAMQVQERSWAWHKWNVALNAALALCVASPACRLVTFRMNNRPHQCQPWPGRFCAGRCAGAGCVGDVGSGCAQLKPHQASTVRRRRD
jgi:hypothetical protein